MHKKFFVFALSTAAACARADIVAGPMAGAADMREASVWVQTEPGARAELSYDAGTPAVLSAEADENGSCKFRLTGLAPASEYKYKVTSGSSSAEGTVKTAPDYLTRTPPPDFSVAVLGRMHRNDATYDEPFKTPGGEYEIFDAVKAKNPQAVIWAGGACMFRTADYGSKSGMAARYSYERSDPALKGLAASVPNYGVMSADCYGAPDADMRLWNREDSLSVFKSFWPNPSFGVGGSENCGTFFRYGDAEFFIMDAASNRNGFDHGASRPEMFGRGQMEWLMSSLAASKAKFKVVVSSAPMVNPAESRENFAGYEKERGEFMDFLMRRKIGGIIFISASKDYGEVTKMVRAGAHELVEVTAGPATARPAKTAAELNFFRVPGSAVLQRSFATVSFSGPEDDRSAEIAFFSPKGERLYSLKLGSKDLYRFE